MRAFKALEFFSELVFGIRIDLFSDVYSFSSDRIWFGSVSQVRILVFGYGQNTWFLRFGLLVGFLQDGFFNGFSRDDLVGFSRFLGFLRIWFGFQDSVWLFLGSVFLGFSKVWSVF
jgi:hypothetical protein